MHCISLITGPTSLVVEGVVWAMEVTLCAPTIDLAQVLTSCWYGYLRLGSLRAVAMLSVSVAVVAGWILYLSYGVTRCAPIIDLERAPTLPIMSLLLSVR